MIDRRARTGEPIVASGQASRPHQIHATGRSLRVLISGAGIAGATLACLLARDGHQVTVVERDQGTRSSGNPVDVRGSAYPVIERLGLVSRLRDVATRVYELVFVDETGRRIARMKTRRGDREIEVPRADLSRMLIESSQQDAEVRFGDTLVGIEPDDHGVNVIFERAAADRFDLVVGADGIHSTVRRLAFGPEAAFVTPFGLYIATVRLATALEREDAVLMYNEPGAAIAIHPATVSPIAAFMFRSGVQLDPRDQNSARNLMTRTYGEAGWRAPDLLSSYLAADDRYFDAVSRVRVPSWIRKRVVLLGDAASCITLFGEGSSSAISGAQTLARSLDAFPRDIARALVHYESDHRALAGRGQRVAPLASHLLIPKSRTGIRLRNRGLRLAGNR